MFLSVIIPTRNRVQLLKRALDSLAAQTYPSSLFEVIVVDNGSTDHTSEMVERLTQESTNLKYVCEKEPGLHACRHLGLKMASGEILVYGDDDIRSFPTWLESIADCFEHHDIALVGGKNLPEFEEQPPQWILQMWEKGSRHGRILTYLSLLDLGDNSQEIDPFYVFGCNFSIRRDVLVQAGGFHPDGMPQELLRFRGDGETHVARHISKHRLKAFYHPKASVYHYMSKSRLTESYFCRRAYLAGISDSFAQTRSYSLKLALKVRFLKLRRFFTAHPRSTIRDSIQGAYLDGFAFHQMEMKKDKGLKEWVLRPNYMD